MQKQTPPVMEIEIRETLDGSRTLYVAEIDEHYHSTFGAVQESLHVFIRQGLGHCKSKDLRILEIGFGTGLNCWLTLLDRLGKGQNITYFTIENHPLAEEIWSQMKYGSYLAERDQDLFGQLHQAAWNCDVHLSKEFILHKISGDLVQLNFTDFQRFDLVYFDAFSPEKQPELWNSSIFEQLFNGMNEDGILVTYCAKGVVRRALQSVGFTVERIPGPPGKREMLRARKLIT